MPELDRYSLIQEVRKVADDLQRPFTVEEFMKISGISSHQIYKLFPRGGWKEILQLAGFEPYPNTPVNKIPDDVLLAEFHRVVTELGKIPSWHLFGSIANISSGGTLASRFGGKQGTITAYQKYLEENYPDSPILEMIQNQVKVEKQEKPKPPKPSLPRGGIFVDERRLDELRSLTPPDFDLSKLIRLCEEINLAYANESYFSVAALTRTVLNHIPPILGFNTFSEVANNYKGEKSFRESMQHLENSSRKIADRHLHSAVRNKEALPTRTQVNFANDLDVLLEEIVRVLK